MNFGEIWWSEKFQKFAIVSGFDFPAKIVKVILFAKDGSRTADCFIESQFVDDFERNDEIFFCDLDGMKKFNRQAPPKSHPQFTLEEN